MSVFRSFALIGFLVACAFALPGGRPVVTAAPMTKCCGPSCSCGHAAGEACCCAPSPGVDPVRVLLASASCRAPRPAALPLPGWPDALAPVDAPPPARLLASAGPRELSQCWPLERRNPPPAPPPRTSWS